jgi:hypothetical protein
MGMSVAYRDWMAEIISTNKNAESPDSQSIDQRPGDRKWYFDAAILVNIQLIKCTRELYVWNKIKFMLYRLEQRLPWCSVGNFWNFFREKEYIRDYFIRKWVSKSLNFPTDHHASVFFPSNEL